MYRLSLPIVFAGEPNSDFNFSDRNGIEQLIMNAEEISNKDSFINDIYLTFTEIISLYKTPRITSLIFE